MSEHPEIGESNSEELHEHHKVVADPGQVVIRIDKFLIDLI